MGSEIGVGAVIGVSVDDLVVVGGSLGWWGFCVGCWGEWGGLLGGGRCGSLVGDEGPWIVGGVWGVVSRGGVFLEKWGDWGLRWWGVLGGSVVMGGFW